VQACGSRRKIPERLFNRIRSGIKNMQYGTSSLARVARLDKGSDVAIFWCLVSTVTAFILATLTSMPVFG
jgi:hypothetical protein